MMLGYWHNYRTGETDYREAPASDEEAVDYLPQGAGTQLYLLYREHSEKPLSVLEAMVKVLSVAVGEKETEPCDD